MQSTQLDKVGMSEIQDVRINTRNGRHFSVELSKRSDGRFVCSFFQEEGRPSPNDTPLGLSTGGRTSEEAFAGFVEGLRLELGKLSPLDSITTVDNPVNALLLGPGDQGRILGNEVTVTVNGATPK